MRILQLSDTHLVATGGRPLAALEAQLYDLRYVGAVDLVVVSGDCSDDGSPASYIALRDRVEAFARPRGAQIVYAMGNHDDRAGFAPVLGDGVGGAADGAGPLGGVVRVHQTRVVVLDSSVPGRTHGEVAASQLAWLRAELRTPAPEGTILVVHHPPVPSVTPLHAGIELQNPTALAAAIAGSDVRLVLSGHYHHFLADALAAGEATVPVVVCPAVVNQNDVVAPPGYERTTAGRGALLVELTPRGPRVEVLMTSSDAVLAEHDPAAVAEIGARINAPGR